METRRPSRREASHSFREHTGEVELAVWAPNLRGVFEQTGRALAELMLGEAGRRQRDFEVVTVEASDLPTLLFDWVNELIFRSEVDKVVFTEFEVVDLSPNRLAARIRGVEPLSIRTAVKAATFHDLEVVESPDGCEATVVLDV